MSEEKESKSVNIGEGIQYHKNPNLNNLAISQETKECLQKNPTVAENVVVIDGLAAMTPFSLERMTVRFVFENMPKSKAETLLGLFEDAQKEKEILCRFKAGEIKHSELGELIRECRIQSAADEMVKWKTVHHQERLLPLDQRASRLLKNLCQKFKGNLLDHSEPAITDSLRIKFFKDIERCLKGEKVF